MKCQRYEKTNLTIIQNNNQIQAKLLIICYVQIGCKGVKAMKKNKFLLYSGTVLGLMGVLSGVTVPAIIETPIVQASQINDEIDTNLDANETIDSLCHKEQYQLFRGSNGPVLVSQDRIFQSNPAIYRNLTDQIGKPNDLVAKFKDLTLRTNPYDGKGHAGNDTGGNSSATYTLLTNTDSVTDYIAKRHDLNHKQKKILTNHLWALERQWQYLKQPTDYYDRKNQTDKDNYFKLFDPNLSNYLLAQDIIGSAKSFNATSSNNDGEIAAGDNIQTATIPTNNQMKIVPQISSDDFTSKTNNTISNASKPSTNNQNNNYNKQINNSIQPNNNQNNNSNKSNTNQEPDTRTNNMNQTSTQPNNSHSNSATASTSNPNQRQTSTDKQTVPNNQNTNSNTNSSNNTSQQRPAKFNTVADMLNYANAHGPSSVVGAKVTTSVHNLKDNYRGTNFDGDDAVRFRSGKNTNYHQIQNNSTITVTITQGPEKTTSNNGDTYDVYYSYEQNNQSNGQQTTNNNSDQSILPRTGNLSILHKIINWFVN